MSTDQEQAPLDLAEGERLLAKYNHDLEQHGLAAYEPFQTWLRANGEALVAALKAAPWGTHTHNPDAGPTKFLVLRSDYEQLQARIAELEGSLRGVYETHGRVDNGPCWCGDCERARANLPAQTPSAS